MGRSLLRLLSIWEHIEETAQKKRRPSLHFSLPIVSENIAHGFLFRCPWFLKTLPIILENDGQRFSSLSAIVSC